MQEYRLKAHFLFIPTLNNEVMVKSLKRLSTMNKRNVDEAPKPHGFRRARTKISGCLLGLNLWVF
jgi:hypothetical protein